MIHPVKTRPRKARESRTRRFLIRRLEDADAAEEVRTYRTTWLDVRGPDTAEDVGKVTFEQVREG